MLDKACQRFGAGMKMSTGEVARRGLRYELMPVSMLISAAVSFCLLLKVVELFYVRQGMRARCCFHKVMSVSDGKPRSVSTILVFFGLDPAPLSFGHARPPKWC